MICYRCNPGGVKPPVSWGQLVSCPHGEMVFANTLPQLELTSEVKVSEPEPTPAVEVKRGPGRPRKAA